MDVGVGFFQFGDFFAGEVGWETVLPELVFTLDFPLRLWRWGIKEANVVKLQCRAQLSECLGVLNEEDAVVIHIELQRASVSQKGGGQEIQVGQQKFALIQLGTDKEATAIVEHVEHGEIDDGARKPSVRRSIQLPEFANLRTLPAPNRSPRFLGSRSMGIAILYRPVTDLGAVELEGVEAKGFRSGEAIGARRRTAQTLFKEVHDGLRPRQSVVTAGAVRSPKVSRFLSTSTAIVGGQDIESAGGEAQLLGRFSGR